MQLFFQERNLIGNLEHFSVIEGVETFTPQGLGALFKKCLDPGVDDLLCDARITPGEADLHHRGAWVMGDDEILF